MAKASTILKKAKSYIGTKEKPANSNNVKFNTDYYGHSVKGSSYPWCCAFVWDIFRMCNASDLFFGGKKTAYCPDVEILEKEERVILELWKKQTRMEHIRQLKEIHLRVAMITAVQ